MDLLEIIISIISLIIIGLLTYALYYISKLQFVASLTTAFQDQWHDRRAVVMRDCLHSKDFENIFNHAIKEAFGKKIDCTKIKWIDDLFTGENKDIIEKYGDPKRFEKFDSYLKNTNMKKNYSKDISFSAFDALYEILLSFDRIALFRNDNFMMKKCIRLYRPPIRDLAIVLQYFIAVRIILREEKLKNYKKDYIHLLGKLSIDEPIDPNFTLNLRLFEECKKGLMRRNELSDKERNSWDEIIKRRQGIEKKSNIYKKSSSYYFARY